MTLALLLRDAPAGGGSSVTLAGTLPAQSTFTGNVNVAIVLASTEAASSSLTGQTSVRFPLAGTVAGSSTVTGTAINEVVLAGTITTASSMTGAVQMASALAGTITAVSTVTGALFFGMSGRIQGQSAIAAGLSVRATLAGLIPAGMVMGDQILPDTILYPSATLYPGLGSARLNVNWTLAGTVASQAVLKAGTTDLGGTIAGSALLGSYLLPASDLLPDAGVYPGLLGGILTVTHPVNVAGNPVVGTSSLTGALVTQVAIGDPVVIVLSFGAAAVTVTLSFDPGVESDVSNHASVLIGVG